MLLNSYENRQHIALQQICEICEETNSSGRGLFVGTADIVFWNYTAWTLDHSFVASAVFRVSLISHNGGEGIPQNVCLKN